MATFSSYNTDDATSGNTPLAGGATQIIGPVQAGIANKVAGSVYADVAGTLYVEQSFDGGNNYDIAQSISVPAATGTLVDVDVLAPIIRFRYVNGASAQAHFRMFVRTFGNRSS